MLHKKEMQTYLPVYIRVYIHVQGAVDIYVSL